MVRNPAPPGRLPVALSSVDPYPMNNLFRGLLAGAGAWKLGGGCFSTVLIFILLWVLLGQC